MPFVEGVPTVTVQLDRPRQIAYTLGAMRRFRDLLNQREVGEDDADPLENLLALCLEIWACLDADGRAELSVAQIEDLIHLANLREIRGKLRELQAVSLPAVVPPEEGTEAADPTKAGPQLATG